jgi:uncharacterized protein (TIGR03000 family)
MYSVILMVAMTGGEVVPDHGRRGRRGCYGGYSCAGYGGCYGGYGGYCSGGWGGGYGCNGGGYGCYGGGWGGGYGCYGGGYGCNGGGWGGGYGCYGGMAYGCNGGGGDDTASVGMYYGGYAGGYYGRPGAYRGRAGAPAARAGRAARRASISPVGTTAVAQSGQATIILNVPADARVTFNGQATTSRSTSRTFVTPTLQPDRQYFYDVTAEVDRGGRTVTLSRRIAVRAGQVTREALNLPSTQQVARNP